jgi:hypothetical protein
MVQVSAHHHPTTSQACVCWLSWIRCSIRCSSQANNYWTALNNGVDPDVIWFECFVGFCFQLWICRQLACFWCGDESVCLNHAPLAILMHVFVGWVLGEPHEPLVNSTKWVPIWNNVLATPVGNQCKSAAKVHFYGYNAGDWQAPYVIRRPIATTTLYLAFKCTGWHTQTTPSSKTCWLNGYGISR